MAKFSVRARAVDMLGRQQIAGIPTAIHELFKNAHDAYATRVEVDFIRAQNRLVIRDNGLGMTRDDFTNRWLALGTESKFGANAEAMAKWTGPEGLPVRPLMGEKGIGRLAIATIAPVTFVISRAVREDTGLSELVACMVCWRLFELPGLDISDVDIPLETFTELPKLEDVERMVQQIEVNIKSIIDDEFERNDLLDLMGKCKFDPATFDDWFASVAEEVEEPNLSLSGNQYGTHFFMFECDESLLVTINEDEASREAPPIKRILLGFGNAMSPEYLPPVKAEFRDHKLTNNFDELIGGDQFFKSGDLEQCDQYFEGEFDAFGQFRGTIKIFHGNPEAYVLSWPEAKGTPVACGPFKLRLGVIQGLAHESELDEETYLNLKSKTERYGGLYVYRDGVRILPYGQPDVDWLSIEYRRTLSARDWFFSHRRMAGYIDLNRHDNHALSEKAGREGFIQNQAYRSLQAILDNWFQQVAKDYFRKTSDRSPRYREVVDTKKLAADLLKKQKDKSSELKAKFRRTLDTRHDEIESAVHEAAVREVVDVVKSRLKNLQVQIEVDAGELSRLGAGAESLKLENDAVMTLEAKARELALSQPRRFSPTKSDLLAYEAYQGWFGHFRESTLENAIDEVRSHAAAVRSSLGAEVSKSERARSAIESEAQQLRKKVKELQASVSRLADEMSNSVVGQLKVLVDEFSNQTSEAQADLQRTNFDALGEENALKKQRSIEKKLYNSYQYASSELVALSQQMQSLGQNISEGGLPDETTAALEGRVVELEEQLTYYNDLAQAGSAVSIIGHELENVVSGLRGAIRDIKPWADGTPELSAIFERLRTYYEHLDSYLGLFSPLTRRVRRRRAEVTGESVLAYVQELFSERLENNGIELRATEAFRKQTITTFRSTLIAAVVNIVDNAVYWICSDQHSQRWLQLDSYGQGIVISNGGPGISLRAASSIFEYGVSNKPGGRGMGLAVSREALGSVGLKLELLTEGTDSRPAFSITPDIKGDDKDD